MTTTSLQLRLYGPLEIRVAGVTPPAPRARVVHWLLGLLALRADRPTDRAWLASLLWPDSSDGQALYNLRRNLTELRAILGTEACRLASPDPRSIRLDLRDAHCDALAFDDCMSRPDRPSLERAIGLYRGPLLEACTADWVLPERHAREQVYLRALEMLAARSEPREAAALLRRALVADPTRESVVCALMQALADAGDAAAVTAAYRDFRLRLHREMRLEPASQTTEAFERLRSRGPR